MSCDISDNVETDIIASTSIESCRMSCNISDNVETDIIASISSSLVG